MCHQRTKCVELRCSFCNESSANKMDGVQMLLHLEPSETSVWKRAQMCRHAHRRMTFEPKYNMFLCKKNAGMCNTATKEMISMALLFSIQDFFSHE